MPIPPVIVTAGRFKFGQPTTKRPSINDAWRKKVCRDGIVAIFPLRHHCPQRDVTFDPPFSESLTPSATFTATRNRRQRTAARLSDSVTVEIMTRFCCGLSVSVILVFTRAATLRIARHLCVQYRVGPLLCPLQIYYYVCDYGLVCRVSILRSAFLGDFHALHLA